MLHALRRCRGGMSSLGRYLFDGVTGHLFNMVGDQQTGMLWLHNRVWSAVGNRAIRIIFGLRKRGRSGLR
jgi:hypothetical protein